jgi:hypothetical protein
MNWMVVKGRSGSLFIPPHTLRASTRSRGHGLDPEKDGGARCHAMGNSMADHRCLAAIPPPSWLSRATAVGLSKQINEPLGPGEGKGSLRSRIAWSGQARSGQVRQGTYQGHVLYVARQVR